MVGRRGDGETVARVDRFIGHTRVVLRGGDVLEQPREALYVGGNARAVMASGTAGAIRLAGGESVERGLREKLPLLVGVAYLTEPGELREVGVRHVAYGVTTPQPGTPPSRAPVESALGSALSQLADLRVRAVTVPEVGARIPGITLDGAADLLMDVLVTGLRRFPGFDEIVIVSTHPAYLNRCDERLASIEAGRR